MPIPIIEACRKRKRRPKVYGLHKFAEPGCPINPMGPFRDNVRIFLRECAELEEYNLEGMPVWCTFLHHETKSSILPLYTIEEDVKHSLEPYCDHCRCTGWSNHFVSKRKYHLIIPTDSEWNMPLDKGVFDLQTHLLHGLIHCNGFGHLICINGIEGGSMNVSGREIMDLWDRICTNLRVRKITVEDLSKKRSMDLRLLHGVAYGHTWFGRWGYRFCRGSYGVTKHNFERSIEILSSLELDQIETDFRNKEQSEEIQKVFHHYTEMSEGLLRNFRDLLRFMLTLKSHMAPQKNLSLPKFSSVQKSSTRTILLKNSAIANEKSPKCKKYSTVVANMGSRWPVRRLEYAAEVIVEALKEKKAMMSGDGGMSRQDVRDAARMHIGDTGLLDYVLKSMNNVIVGNFMVRRSINPRTRVLQYTISESDNVSNAVEPKQEMVETRDERCQKISDELMIPGVDVYGDVVFLYTNVLLNYPESELVNSATQAVLDSKHFVKEWSFRDDKENVLRFVCRVDPIFVGSNDDLITELPPGELVFVPIHATVSDLKNAIGEALRDTYCILEKFVVTEIKELGEEGEGVKDGDFVLGKIDSGSGITVRGFGMDLESKLRCQGGCDTWMVRCQCGAWDDDGERMVACDVCEVWQHTRCYGIEDSETLPPLFVCSNCCDSFADEQKRLIEPKYELPSSDDLLFLEADSRLFECLGVEAMS